LRDLDNGRVAFGRMILETTGLADPAPVLQTVMAHPYLSLRLRLDGVITVVDTVNGDATLDQHMESVKQVAVADRIVLTKTDIAEPRAVERLRQRLAPINPAAPPIPAVMGAVEPGAIIGTGFGGKTPEVEAWLAAEAYAGSEHPHHSGHEHAHSTRHRHDDGIRSFCLVFTEPLAWEAAASALDRLTDLAGDKLLRVKGILDVKESDRPIAVHGVQHLFHPPQMLEGWGSGTRTSRIVFITQGLEREQVEPTFLAFLNGPASAG
jgi:G3E family GTPase